MALTPTNPLEEAMLATSEGGDPDAFLAALAANPLYVPAPGDIAIDGERELEPGEQIELPVFEHQSQRFIPVFTSLGQFELGVPAGGRYLRATGADLASIWPEGHALAVNPGGDLSVALAEEDIRGLSGEQEIPEGAELTVGAPAQEPEELWERLRDWAAGEPAVRSAHRALVLVNGVDEQPQLVVGLDLDPHADPGRLLQAGAELLDGEAAFTLIDADEDPLSRWMLEQASPVYSRA